MWSYACAQPSVFSRASRNTHLSDCTVNRPLRSVLQRSTVRLKRRAAAFYQNLSQNGEKDILKRCIFKYEVVQRLNPKRQRWGCGFTVDETDESRRADTNYFPR